MLSLSPFNSGTDPLNNKTDSVKYGGLDTAPMLVAVVQGRILVVLFLYLTILYFSDIHSNYSDLILFLINCSNEIQTTRNGFIINLDLWF